MKKSSPTKENFPFFQPINLSTLQPITLDTCRNRKYQRATAWTSHGGSDSCALWVLEENMCGKANPKAVLPWRNLLY